ncbi:cellulose synthase complex periplasmic endoglucanase BcsZ [Pseudomonas triticifolii]|uniref:Glucanase n=1 Tax=Pseudomonas triticifolii TaxID=2762592 RepID=A0ABR7BIA2_9PSED|nr:cellulose synthase complex periplasmic endoglucanase BcsZ [Pseudomonas triticifolii]MBC3956912.1 cellulase [Pseudomonas triticifolii]
MKRNRLNAAGPWLAAALLQSLPVLSAAADMCHWPAWERYLQHLVSQDGRVIDGSSGQQVTTSEGQSYALFFALVANDPQSFERLLNWTRNNLANGDLERQLPAWQWGRDQSGRWQVLDSNNASDADLWIAYSLLEAGRLWKRPDYETLGQHLLWRSAAQTLRKLPGLGLMLMPGDKGFESPEGWRLNPSYLPPQLLTRFAALAPIWAEVARNNQRLLLEATPQGLAPDWLMWRTDQRWAPDPAGPKGSYDAIRVYLWLGMLDEATPGRGELMAHFKPMRQAIAQLGGVPEQVDTLSGATHGIGPVGFSAALLPLLADDPALRDVQRARLKQTPPLADAYYNQSLLLFGQGWDEQRYRFDRKGLLQPGWVAACQ